MSRVLFTSGRRNILEKNNHHMGKRVLLIALTMLLVCGGMPMEQIFAGVPAGVSGVIDHERDTVTRDTYQGADSPAEQELIRDEQNIGTQADGGTAAFAGGDGSPENPYLIETAEQLNAVRNDLSAHYQLEQDVDLSAYHSIDGWEEIGGHDAEFNGTLDGQGHVITGLMVGERVLVPSGLFGIIGEVGVVENVILQEVKVGARNYYQMHAGGLAGINYGRIHEVHVTGTVEGSHYSGGLVGMNHGKIQESSFIGTVSGLIYVGGLTGLNRGRISESVVSVQVSGEDEVGALVGRNESEIHASYGKGNVNPVRFSGGLVGTNLESGVISFSYFNGTVSGGEDVGGLVGTNRGLINSSYWNISAYIADPPDNGFGTAATEEEMKRRSTYEGWDFADTWYLYDGGAPPFLQWEDPFTSMSAHIEADALNAGDTSQLTVNAQHQQGSFDATLSSEYTVTEGEQLIEVSRDGMVTAAKPGRASIMVTLHGLTAEVDVVVNPYTITRIEQPEPIAIVNGTKADQIGLPETVRVLLSPGDYYRDVPVKWNIDDYDRYQADVPGVYTFIGTLVNLPEDVGNPDGLTAAANVVVGDPYIKEVNGQEDIRVVYGTDKSTLGLPEQVEVLLSNGKTTSADVTWNDGDPEYDGGKADVYTFTGTLELPEGVLNPDHLAATVNVIVGSPFLIKVSKLNEMKAANGTARSALKLPEQIPVTLNNEETIQVSVTWDDGQPKYDGGKAGVYTFTGTLELPEGVLNLEGLTATIIVTVQEKSGTGGGSDGGGGSGGNGGGAEPEDHACEVGYTGKTITFANGRLTIPSGAWNGSFCITVREVKDTRELSFTDGERLVSQVIAVEKNLSGSLNKEAIVTMQFNPAALKEDEVTVGLYWYDDDSDKWVQFDNTAVDWENDTVSGSIGHFAKFAVIAREIGNKEQEKPDKPDKPKSETAFPDLHGHWAEERIRRLAEIEAVSGYPDGTFKPDNTMTRADFAAILVRALKLERRSGRIYSDTRNHWAQDVVATAQAYGIIEGHTQTYFGANEPITREQLAAMIMRAAGFSSGGKAGAITFVDRDRISPWAQEAVAALSEHGIMTGYPDGSFQPQKSATRAEAAATLYYLLQIQSSSPLPALSVLPGRQQMR